MDGDGRQGLVVGWQGMIVGGKGVWINHHSDCMGIRLRLSTTNPSSFWALRSLMNWLTLTSVDFLDC